MRTANLLHELLWIQEDNQRDHVALTYQQSSLAYCELAEKVRRCAASLIGLGVRRGDRIAVYMEKRPETVVAMFAAAAAGGVFVPINPLLKPPQVAYIMNDCAVRVLVTTADRFALLQPLMHECGGLTTAVVVGASHNCVPASRLAIVDWEITISDAGGPVIHRVIDTDIVAILYTSGTTGKPKGVVLSHRNMVAGARSVAQYLENRSSDRILALLPLSFDAGFSQLTTAFHCGARVVLMNYLLPRDVVDVVVRERITGITAVPPLWIQLADQSWPASVTDHLRYIANTGGRMPKATLDKLRTSFPKTAPFLMYGLTESFRSTYLPPSEVDRRPDSIGKAIPNAEVLVVREDGSPCAPREPGELVHRGALVSLGYWNDPAKTAERFKPAPNQPAGLTMPEMAVWSGDTVMRDEEGYLYFIGRRDEMIKTSGYRVSPTEIEEVVYATGIVGEAAALGVPHPVLGQAIVLVVTAAGGSSVDCDRVLAACRQHLPNYMAPALVKAWAGILPRNPNGKIDRKRLAEDMNGFFTERA